MKVFTTNRLSIAEELLLGKLYIPRLNRAFKVQLFINKRICVWEKEAGATSYLDKSVKDNDISL